MSSTQRHRQRNQRGEPQPFQPWKVSEIAAAARCTDTHIYSVCKADLVPLGRLRRLPYKKGKELLGDLTDEQVLELRRNLAKAGGDA